MKIDRRRPEHWWYLALFALNAVCATVLRWLGPSRPRGMVLFYGHKLNGNLAAVFAQAQRTEGFPQVAFLTMDPDYLRQLEGQGVPCVLATSAQCIPVLAKARAVVTDHGLHSLEIMARLSTLPCFDVWHGIPFKGFDADDFRTQHRYAETWVSSPLLASLYVERFGFEPGRVKVTGYARTDRLVRPQESRESLLAKFGLQDVGDRKLVLFAPTWKQDASGRSIFPFGASPEEFFARLESLCRQANACLLFRSHLNSGDSAGPASAHIRYLPHGRHPDTEGLLLLSDALVCDWSSIAFDYLVLDRPTVFLDVPPPFAKGFSLGPEYRFGAVVSSLDELTTALERQLSDPLGYLREHGASHARIRDLVYGDFADGQSGERCVARLQGALG